MLNLTTEQLADYYYQNIIAESKEKQIDTDWFFDFSIMKSDIPSDFDEDVFINYFKERLDLKNIKIDKLNTRFRCYGTIAYNSQDIYHVSADGTKYLVKKEGSPLNLGFK